MVDSVRRGGRVAVALITLGLASTLAACASGNTGTNAGVAASGSGTSTAKRAPMLPAPSPTGSSSASPTINPGGRMSPSPAASATAQVTQPPVGAKYVPIMKATQSSDGRSLYVEIEARGGACGQYVVVLQQSSSEVRVGLAQLPVRTGVMCPMYIGPRTFTVQLSSPIDGRAVIDLSNGAQLGS